MALLFKEQRVQLLKVKVFWVWFLPNDRLHDECEALTPEGHVGHMVFGRPQVRCATQHQVVSGQVLEKSILAELGLAQEVKEHWLKRMVHHELFFLASWW